MLTTNVVAAISAVLLNHCFSIPVLHLLYGYFLITQLSPRNLLIKLLLVCLFWKTFLKKAARIILVHFCAEELKTLQYGAMSLVFINRDAIIPYTRHQTQSRKFRKYAVQYVQLWTYIRTTPGKKSVIKIRLMTMNIIFFKQ